MKQFRIKIIAVVSFLLLATNIISAQKGQLLGTIVDKNTNEPVPFATVLLKSDAKATGTSSDFDGKFTLENVALGTYQLVISYIGFEDTTINAVKITSANQLLDLGVIALSVNTQALKEVIVTGVNKTQVTKIDRKTYAASDFKTAKGGNAADVLGKLPSVTVQPDGNVSVRGTSDFMVYLNGKPTNIDATTLLNQIASNSIDKIDIISVPTARYDAQGKGGIVNIKTKSSGTQGFSATATGTLGGAPWANDTDIYSGHEMTDARYVAGVNLIYNTKFYSIHGSFNYNEKNVNGMRIGRARVLAEEDETHPTAYFHMNAQGERPEWYKYYSSDVGVDFHLSDTKELSFSYFYGSRNNGRAAYYVYDIYNGSIDTPVENGTSIEHIYNPNIDNRYGDYNTVSIDYTIDFEEGSDLKVSGTYENSRLSRELTNTNYFYNSRQDLDDDVDSGYHNGSRPSSEYGMSDNTPLKGYRASVDYQKETDNGNTIGVGVQFQNIGIEGNFEFYNDLVTADLDNTIDLNRDVYAAYIDYAGTSSKWSYNLGLRTEYGKQDTYISNTSYLGDFGLSEQNNYAQSKLDLFPSAHINYQVNENTRYILAASRRINRPSLTKMAPFLYRRHFEVYVIGDPTLESEYLNNVEFSYDTNIGKQNINVTGFYRGTENAVFRVNTTTTAVQNPTMQDILQEDVLIRSYTNAGNSSALGGELTSNLFVNSWMKLLVGGSLYNYKIKGDVFGYAVNQESTNWSVKGNMNIDTSKETSLTLDYNYTSGTVTSQGSNDYFQMANIAFNYNPEKWEGWSFSLRGIDLLSTNLQGLDTNAFNETNQQIFYQETEYHRNGPILEIGATYTLNTKGKKAKKAKKVKAEEHFK